MGVTFVLGRTASQRDERVALKIKQIAERDPLAEVLVVVPPQSTYITEKQLMRALHAKGLMGVCVQSPARICDRVLESTYGKAVAGIDAAGEHDDAVAFRPQRKRPARPAPVREKG